MPLQDCLNDINSWIAQHFLQFNTNKTELVFIGSQQVAKQILPSTFPHLDYIKPASKSLGVWFNSNLSFDRRVRLSSLVFITSETSKIYVQFCNLMILK